jgi:membrane-associated protein
VDAFLHDIIRLLLDVGPWIVFLVTASETAIFIGLLVPAEATVLLAAFLAETGYFDVRHVLLATLAGGFVGDQIGYALGRFSGRRAAAHDGWIGRLWRSHEARATVLFQKRSIISITVARFISFVRTLMPWLAGMTRMSYPRFLVYDTLGVLGWGVASVTAGYLAGRSWHALAGVLGTVSALVVAAILTTLASWASGRAAGPAPSCALPSRATLPAARPRSRTCGGATAPSSSTRTNSPVRWWSRGRTACAASSRRSAGTSWAATAHSTAPPLRRRVFDDERKRRELEAILHPEIERLRKEREAAAAAVGERLVVHVIPLLFETGLDAGFDTIVLVDAAESVRRERLVRTRGLDGAEADAMIAAQMPASEKRDAPSFVIENDGDLESLTARAEEVWAEIEAGAG